MMRSQQEIERDVKESITTHLRLSDNNHDAICLWKGYIAGLLEWGVIDRQAFDRLFSLLPEGPEDQVMREIFHLD